MARSDVHQTQLTKITQVPSTLVTKNKASATAQGFHPSPHLRRRHQPRALPRALRLVRLTAKDATAVTQPINTHQASNA
jgi:hypothetical protein